jgi:hypothetical protein
MEVNIPNQLPFLRTRCKLCRVNAAVQLNEVVGVIEVYAKVVEVWLACFRGYVDYCCKSLV